MTKLVVSNLNPIVARRVLMKLVERQPELDVAITELVNELSLNPVLEDLTIEIESELGRITVAEIYGNSGRTATGYREPDEAAGDLISGAMRPYFERLEKLSKDENAPAALVLCEAIILALYRVKCDDPFFDADPDLNMEDLFDDRADWAARIWRSGGNMTWAGQRRFVPDRLIPKEFVQQFVPEWEWLLSED